MADLFNYHADPTTVGIMRKSTLTGRMSVRDIHADQYRVLCYMVAHDYPHAITMGFKPDHIMYKQDIKLAGTMLIQDLFPYLSDDDREFLLTGITPEEWDSAFPDE